jgi:thymidylate kinase
LVLEGVDFCGKTTLATTLVEKLIEKYGSINVVHKKEPSSFGYGLKMRNVLFSDEDLSIEKEIIAAKYMLLDRINNTSEVSQLLRENKIVVQERNFLTALVYNEGSDKDEVKFIQEINKFSLKPDFLALVNVSDTMLNYRIGKSKEERGKLDSYETFEKVIKRKRDYMNFGDYIDILLPNDNQDCFEDSINALIKIVNENFKGKR